MNSDCEISDNFAENILKCFDSDKNIIAASPVASDSADYYIMDSSFYDNYAFSSSSSYARGGAIYNTETLTISTADNSIINFLRNYADGATTAYLLQLLYSG